MPRISLTDLAVKRLNPPAAGQVDYWDTRFPGFGLRVGSKGTKAWCLVYRRDGRQKRLTLGRYPALSPATAREAARHAIGQLAKGKDPSVEKKRDAEAEQRRKGDTFERLAEEYDRRHLKGLRRGWETERIIRRELMPFWADRPVRAISKRDCIVAVDRVADRGKTRAAIRLRGIIRHLFEFAKQRDWIDDNPAADVPMPGKAVSRDRVLDDDELRRVWMEADRLGYAFGTVLKVMILTLQRRGEVASMRWRDLDLEEATWTLPREATKADRAHVVPLAPLTVETLRSLPRFAGGDYVFGRATSGRAPLSGFSRSKARLDQSTGVENWRLHDIRRTGATGMARAGVHPHIISRTLNHADATSNPVTAIYNRHHYEPEIREAFERWADTVGAHDPAKEASNVVAIR